MRTKSYTASRYRNRLIALALIGAGLTICAPGSNSPSTNATPAIGADAVAAAGGVSTPERVSPNGAYQTFFEIPVLPAPAAPKVRLLYDSTASTTLAGVGWDLSVGFPTAIMRDIRFGTPIWSFGAPWMWGSTPLVRTDDSTPKCKRCRYRTAPDTLTEIVIDLSTGGATAERATINLPNGTSLDYEPVYFDGTTNPAAPAGSDTNVFGFRLVSAVDRNGFRMCFSFHDYHDVSRGQMFVLSEISYGTQAVAASCAAILTSPTRHRVTFEYVDAAQQGFAATWTLKYGSPVTFGSLLQSIYVYANGSDQQDWFLLVHDGQTSITARPRLSRIDQIVNLPNGAQGRRAVRAYRYGDRTLQFDVEGIVELTGDVVRFPPSVAGSVSRPMRRPDPFDNPLGIGQLGQDVPTSLAPLTHATTEQWSLTDMNADGLADFFWAREKGVDPSVADWSTFETAPLNTVRFSDRPAQQVVFANEGIIGAQIHASRIQVKSGAPDLENAYPPGLPDLHATPVQPPIDGFSPWYWGDGNGMTRTGMPVSVSGAEIFNGAPTCPLDKDQDSRLWPRYPDGTDRRSPGSVVGTLAQLTLVPSGNTYFGNPVMGVIEDAYKGYRPTYSVSATLSGWADLDGDGIPEFVATLGMIERFGVEVGCRRFTPSGLLQPEAFGARTVYPAGTGMTGSFTPDSGWFSSGLANGAGPLANLTLMRRAGPAATMSLPLSYDVSTASAETASITLPIGGSASAALSSQLGGGWLSMAAAAPGLSVDHVAPRSVPGYSASLSIPAPSATGMIQGAATSAYTSANPSVASNSGSGASAAGFIMSLVRVTFDLTLLSTQTANRSETRAQLVDLNGDGLPDYVLYNTGTHTDPLDPLLGIAPGSLVAFLNSPGGTFGPPIVVNKGFAYAVPPPDPDGIDGLVADARLLIEPLNNPLLGPNLACYAGLVACGPFSALIGGVAAKADEVRNRSEAFLQSSRDATPRERTLLSEVRTLADTLKTMAIALPLQPPSPVLSPLVDTTVAAANSTVRQLGAVARAVREVAHPSRINLVSEGFSELDGAWIGSSANGMSVQTKGFVDLNGDGLPDYVITDDRDNLCKPGEWIVYWGNGTSAVGTGSVFLSTPSCIAAPPVPPEIAAAGYTSLPLNVDRIQRAGSGSAQSVDTVVQSLVSLVDFNHDGRPDVLIAGSTPWDPNAASRDWQVFLNTGSGFARTAVTVASPTTTRTDLEPASTEAMGLNVPYPLIRTTRTVSNIGNSRDSSDTHAAMVDIDGDGIPEMVRRVHIVTSDGTKKEALLFWKHSETGPQDLMIEEREPLLASREFVEYRPASAFQWPDAMPDGNPPPLGHQNLTSVPGRLVRSVTSERMMGRADGRVRHGYDYKEPLYDTRTRTVLGFATHTIENLDPSTGAPIPASLTTIVRNAQRPNGVPGPTLSRVIVQGTAALVSEALTSYTEVTDATGGAGGLAAVYSLATRTLSTDYPDKIHRPAIFDVGFDGRQPLRDRARNLDPTLLATSPQLDPSEATGGAAIFDPQTPTPLSYPSPFSAARNSTGGGEVTVEAWIKPVPGAANQVIVNQPGSFRLLVVNSSGQPQVRFEAASGTGVTSSAANLSGRWTHVIATAAAETLSLFINGVAQGSTVLSTPPTPTGALTVGCTLGTAGATECFGGAIGELRIYPESWSLAPRVAGSESEAQLADATQPDFGQIVRTINRNDLSTPDDDVITEFTYAAPTAGSNLRGAVSSEAMRAVAADGQSSGAWYKYLERRYDGHALGAVSAGNVTELAQYDGPSGVSAKPGPNALNVRTRTQYDAACPGRVHVTTDPDGFTSTTYWDATCAFLTDTVNALGHVAHSTFYGVNYTPATASPIQGPFGSWLLRGRFGQLAQTIDANGGVTLNTYDEWSRPVAVWGPLDRSDRPGQRFEYADAVCDDPSRSGAMAVCATSPTVRLHSPALTTSLVWDDELRRCRGSGGRTVLCRASDAIEFLNESATGDYLATYRFDDGQIQAQTARDGHPDWTVAGVDDLDALGRITRTYKIAYLPRMPTASRAACPDPGTWCDSTGLAGDPLRAATATLQTAYDARGRVIRSYGPGWPRCDDDPSALDSGGQPACDSKVQAPAPRDVTVLAYPAPGDLLTTDAIGAQSLVQRDTRGLIVTQGVYLRPPSTGPPGNGVPSPYSTARRRYDILGRPIRLTEESSAVSTTEYDALSRIVSSDDPDRGHIAYVYDHRSHITQQTNATADRTVHSYDALGRVVQTDYLRPHLLSAETPACCQQPADGNRPHVNPNSCHIVAGIPGDLQLVPIPIPPRPWDDTLDPLLYEAGGTNPVAATLTLTFELSVSATPVAGANRTISTAAPKMFTFAPGTQIQVQTDGTLVLQSPTRPTTGPRARTAYSSRGILQAFATPLMLDPKGLRSALSGTVGARQLTIEWRGHTFVRGESRQVVVRALLTEHGTPIRFEYDEAPSDAGAQVGVRLVTDDGTEYGAVGTFGEKLSPALAGGAVEFGEYVPFVGFGVNCHSDAAEIEIPVIASGPGPQLFHLRYGVYAMGDAVRARKGDPVADLSVGYRVGKSGDVIRPIGRFRTLVRGGTPALDRTSPDVATFQLPDGIQSGDITLVVGYQLPPGFANPIHINLWSVAHQTVVYDIEERVRRTRDHHTPEFYVWTTAAGTRFEDRPILDVPFDVPGHVDDRSPSNARISCGTGFTSAATMGVSGQALALPASKECDASLRPRSLHEITAEFWARPHDYPASARRLFAADQVFGVLLRPDGRVSCDVPGAASVVSRVALPRDAWAHVALSYDGQVLKCAVNGEVKSVTIPPRAGNAFSVSTLRLGDKHHGPATDFDELRVLDHVRSDAELLSDALEPLAGGAPRGNLVQLDFSRPSSPGTDASQAANNASFTGSGTALGLPVLGSLVPGAIGTALDTGMGERVTIPDTATPTTLALTDAVTAEVWLKPRVGAPQAGAVRLVGKWTDAAHPGWRLEYDVKTARIRWEVVTTTPGQQIATIARDSFVTLETFPADEWHHVAATFDGHRLRVYRDGLPTHRLCGSSDIEQVASTAPFQCQEPPPVSGCAAETTSIELPSLAIGESNTRTLGDAVCLTGQLANRQPILIARDAAGAAFAGVLDDVRVSNYSKREVEVAASARLPSAYTQTLGLETFVRNRLPVNPVSNDLPIALADYIAREQRDWDLRGRVVSSLKFVRGQQEPADFFRSRSAPDALSRYGLVEHSHGEVLVAEFDPDGTQRTLTGYGPHLEPAADQRQTYVRNATSTVTGRRATAEYGNGPQGHGVRAVWSYDDGPVSTTPDTAFGPDTLHSAQFIGTPLGATTAADLSNRTYSWDPVGNLTSIVENASGAGGGPFTVGSYGYDDLRRVTSATLADPVHSATYTYRYDPVGNLTVKEGDASGNPTLPESAAQEYGVNTAVAAQCPLGHPALTHALIWRTAGSGGRDRYCYDEAGRLVSSRDSGTGNARILTYYVNGHLSSLTDASGTARFAFDGNGVRVSRLDPNGTTTTIIGPQYRELYDPSATATRRVRLETLYSAGGEFVTRRLAYATGIPPDPQNVIWYSADHVKSTIFVTDATGASVSGSETYYRPFGDYFRAPTSGVAGAREFASKELDPTGLYDFGFRPFDPITGRFTQPDDTLGARVPEGLNRFAYGLNNPLAYTDPTGHDDAPASEAWQSNPVRPSGEGARKAAALRQQAVDRHSLSDQAAHDKTSQAFAASKYTHYLEEADRPPDVWAPGFKAAWPLMNAWYGKTISDIPVDRSEALQEAGSSLVEDYFKVEMLFELSGAAAGEMGAATRILRNPTKFEGYILGQIRCLLPGSRVLMADGTTKAIEDVAVGDYVVAQDPVDAKPPSAHRVTGRLVNHTEHAVDIEIRDGAGHTGHVEATREHPFWVKGIGWKEAAQLVPDNVLLDREDHDVHVTRVAVRDVSSPTYNLTVEDVETFFVVDHGVSVLSHNAEPFQIGTMKSLTGKLNAWDYLDAHEPLPNAYLRAIGEGNPYFRTEFPENPAIALPRDVHVKINQMQAKWGIQKLSTLKKLTPTEVVHQNYEFMVRAGVPEPFAREVAESALAHAEALGIQCP
jgi:RHS repeat-associated protein